MKALEFGETLTVFFLTEFSSSLSQFALVRWVEEGEEALVLFGGVHSSERQECGLEEG